MRRVGIYTALALVAAAGVLWWLTHPPGDSAASVMPAGVDIARGERLYSEHCASCHGADLEGQPDWRSPGPDGRFPAPPHDETGHTWHHSDRALFEYTKLGGRAALARQGVAFESGMPGFAEGLTDEEIWDVLAFIRSTWPERIRAHQAERTAADLAGGDG